MCTEEYSSSEESDYYDHQNDRDDDEKLIITKDTYNTLNRSVKSVSFNSLPMKRKMSEDSLLSKYPIIEGLHGLGRFIHWAIS